MTFFDAGQGLKLTAEDIASELRAFPKDENGSAFLGMAAIGMGHMMGSEGEEGAMSQIFLDAIVVLGKSSDRGDKRLAAKLGMLYQQGKRSQDEEAGLFVLPSQPAGE